jgi:ribosomal protein S18 acetylase RimI-like enzyme
MKNPEITLRAATPADEQFLFDLRRATMEEHLERAGEPTDDDAHWARLRYRYDDAHIVCSGPERLGLFKFFREPGEWTIVQIQILPGWQGHGIGAQLIGELLRQADHARVAVNLKVPKGSRAIHLYRRLGFQVVDETSTSFQMSRKEPVA